MFYSDAKPAPKPEQIAVTAPGPYPEIRVEGSNPQYARMMQQNIAAARGELTAITQYLYSSWIFNREYSEYAETILRISEVEMRHLETFGRLTVLLGGDPKLAAMNAAGFYPWNGNMLCYTKSIRQALLHNSSLEKEAAETYSRQANVIRDPYLSLILARISEDEALHHQIFEQFLARLLP